MIRAIETQYRGYRFRSRLEARWAVFFDRLGIKWEYEIEAYRLASGVGYLPDFYLPRISGGVFVEVKPVEFDCLKAIQFAEESDRAMLLARGTPAAKYYEMFAPEWQAPEVAQEFDCGRGWGAACFSLNDRDKGDLWWEYDELDGLFVVHPAVYAASDFAKSYRFEPRAPVSNYRLPPYRGSYP